MQICLWGGLALLGWTAVSWGQSPGERFVLSGPLSLNEAVTTALRESPMVKGQSAEVEGARARLRRAVADTRLIGSATSHVTAGDGVNMLSGPSSVMPSDMEMIGPSASFNQNLTALFPLYTGGRLKSRVTSARSLYESIQADEETVRQDIQLDTRVAYRRVLWTRAVVDIFQALVDADQERLRIDRAMYDAGKVPLVNVLRNEADLADAQQKLTDARRDLNIARVDLKTVMGVDQKSDFVPSEQLALENLNPEGDTVQQLALESRPELQAVSKRLEAAGAEVKVAHSAFKPQVDFAAVTDWRSQRGAGNDAGVTVGVIASLPLLDGGSRKAQVAEAKADVQNVRQDGEQIKLIVTKQVHTSLLQLTAATQNITTAQAAVKAAEEDYRLAQLRYSSGKGINLEPLDALSALTRARTNLVQALFEQNVAIDMLERAVGAPVRGERQ